MLDVNSATTITPVLPNVIVVPSLVAREGRIILADGLWKHFHRRSRLHVFSILSSGSALEYWKVKARTARLLGAGLVTVCGEGIGPVQCNVLRLLYLTLPFREIMMIVSPTKERKTKRDDRTGNAFPDRFTWLYFQHGESMTATALTRGRRTDPGKW
jgi:hypothetical protein